MRRELLEVLWLLPTDHAVVFHVERGEGVPDSLVGEIVQRAPPSGWPTRGQALNLTPSDPLYGASPGYFAWDDVVLVSAASNVGSEHVDLSLATWIFDRFHASGSLRVVKAETSDDGGVCDVCHGDDTCMCAPEDTEGAYG